jgi:hypothetical protein
MILLKQPDDDMKVLLVLHGELSSHIERGESAIITSLTKVGLRGDVRDMLRCDDCPMQCSEGHVVQGLFRGMVAEGEVILPPASKLVAAILTKV